MHNPAELILSFISHLMTCNQDVKFSNEMKRQVDTTATSFCKIVESRILITNNCEGVLGDTPFTLCSIKREAFGNKSFRDSPIQVIQALDDSRLDRMATQTALAGLLDFFARCEAKSLFPNPPEIIDGGE
ncbi:hypothetical protein SAMN05421541_102609 [Actinoplanes philippinensis]|uniref:Uncharacterized protein n=1 Tax=Actinoplanes philippinensis TaxID=35752 RepID=A0A1I2BZG4_9ACTN|nr:hypothetical protein SAMN05421541_102609 [Actinoplanes philippinensis]